MHVDTASDAQRSCQFLFVMSTFTFDSFDQALPVEPNYRNESAVETMFADTQADIIDSSVASLADVREHDVVATPPMPPIMHDRQVTDESTLESLLHTALPPPNPHLPSPDARPGSIIPGASGSSLESHPDESLCDQMERELRSVAANSQHEAKPTASSAKIESEETDRRTQHHEKRVQTLQGAIDNGFKARRMNVA